MKKGEKGEQSKNKLIECAAELFWKNGYSATGINDILAEAQLPKGSFYFYFSSKKDLAVEVAAYYENIISQWIWRTAQGKDWETFISDLLREMLQSAKSNRHFGCPFAVMGLEIAFSEPDIAVHYADSMKKLQKIFESVLLISGIPAEKVPILANRAFAVYEGHLLLFRISKDIEVLKTMRGDLIGLYKDYIAANVNV